MKLLAIVSTLVAVGFGAVSADAATIVALGASNTRGKGVAISQAYPAQLQAILRAHGKRATVLNAGINGDTTSHMLSRMNGLLSADTKVVILQPGGNDRRKGKTDEQSNVSSIQAKLSGRGIALVMLPNTMLRPKPHQPDGQHLTPEGYHQLAEELAPSVEAALGR
jgi:acyl-CoA thioesterase-1